MASALYKTIDNASLPNTFSDFFVSRIQHVRETLPIFSPNDDVYAVFHASFLSEHCHVMKKVI